MSGLKVVKNVMITFKIKMRSSPAETDSLWVFAAGSVSIKAYGSSPLNVFRFFHCSTEFISCRSKLRYSDGDIKWVFDVSGKVYDRFCNLQQFFVFKVTGADIREQLGLVTAPG